VPDDRRIGDQYPSIIRNVTDDGRVELPCPEAVEMFVFIDTFVQALVLTMLSNLLGLREAFSSNPNRRS
jgi:hypothetical protein